MRNKSLVVSILVAAIFAGPALAEEVIHFTNGTVLPIRSHVIEGDMVKIDLGEDGFMAFPKSVVAKIEHAPDVSLKASTGSNKMFKTQDASTRVVATSPRQQPGNSWALPMNQAPKKAYRRAPGGVPVRQAFPDDPNPKSREIMVVDRAAMRDTANASRHRAAGANRVSLPNSTIKQSKTYKPFSKK